MDTRAAIERLRARANRPWPRGRDLVFAYRPPDERPRIELLPIARAIFAKLAPGRMIPEPCRVEDHAYDWGDSACVTADGDGVFLADFASHARMTEVPWSRAACCVAVRDDGVVTVECESAPYGATESRVMVRLSTTVDAVDVVTDAILEVAPGFGLACSERIDTPVRAVHWVRSAAAVRAFEQVLACPGSPNKTAHLFAWIVIGMVPSWFEFARDEFAVERGVYDAAHLVWSRARRQARIALSSSRNIECVATDGDNVIDRGDMGMHYTPSADQYERARRVVLCALRWLFPDRTLDDIPSEVLVRIPPGRVFPDG